MPKTISQDKVIDLLKKKQGKRSLRQFAKEMGISAPYLCDIYKGRRNPGPAVVEQLGIVARKEIVTEYQYSQQ